MRDSIGAKHMAKFSQNTLNQVAGFDGQILAENLYFHRGTIGTLPGATSLQLVVGKQAQLQLI